MERKIALVLNIVLLLVAMTEFVPAFFFVGGIAVVGTFFCDDPHFCQGSMSDIFNKLFSQYSHALIVPGIYLLVFLLAWYLYKKTFYKASITLSAIPIVIAVVYLLKP